MYLCWTLDIRCYNVTINGMIILLHVIMAFSSVICTTYLHAQPSRRKLYASYGLIVATLVSGTYLVISTHSPLLSSCVTGLVYLAVVLSLLFSARSKIAE